MFVMLYLIKIRKQLKNELNLNRNFTRAEKRYIKIYDKNKFSDKLVYKHFLDNHLDSECSVISITRKTEISFWDDSGERP